MQNRRNQARMLKDLLQTVEKGSMAEMLDNEKTNKKKISPQLYQCRPNHSIKMPDDLEARQVPLILTDHSRPV